MASRLVPTLAVVVAACLAGAGCAASRAPGGDGGDAGAPTGDAQFSLGGGACAGEGLGCVGDLIWAPGSGRIVFAGACGSHEVIGGGLPLTCRGAFPEGDVVVGHGQALVSGVAVRCEGPDGTVCEQRSRFSTRVETLREETRWAPGP